MRAHAPSARWLILVVMALAVLLLLWYLFRPERLFINRTINEPPPQSMLLRPSMILRCWRDATGGPQAALRP
jgi:hypothetical protein